MKFKSQIITQGSGSIGGITYSHNSSGLYQRARAIPVNPNSTFQVQIRAAFTTLVNRWSSVLTPAQRAAWELYALNVPVTNTLGDPILLSGQNWYIGNNSVVLQAQSKGFGSTAIVDTAPTTFDRGDFTTPTVTSDVSTGTTVNVTTTDAWASDDGAAMLIWQGLPTNASRNFFNGPWRLIGELAGDSTTPPSTLTITPAQLASRGYAYAAGQRVYYYFRVARGDGRLSSRQQVSTDAVA